MESSEVLLEKGVFSRTLILNRPKQLNALNLNMVRILNEAYKYVEKSEHCRVAILKGNAPGRAFCAGGDIKAVYENPLGTGKDFFSEEYELDYRVGNLSKPHVALLDGITMGGGVGLSVHGAFRIATENAVFAMPETAIGFFPDVGGSHFLSRLPCPFPFPLTAGVCSPWGMFLALTGHRLKGSEVALSGVATHFVPSVQLPALENRLSSADVEGHDAVARLISEFDDPMAVAETGFLSLLPPAEHGHRRHVGEDQEYLENVYALIAEAFDPARTSNVQQCVAILTGKQEHLPFAQQTLKLLSRMSPTSLAITWEQLKRGAGLDLAECLVMEYRIAMHLMQSRTQNDFMEGVRSLLIDKTNKPAWSPSSLSDVKESDILPLFEPLRGAVADLRLPQSASSASHSSTAGQRPLPSSL